MRPGAVALALALALAGAGGAAAGESAPAARQAAGLPPLVGGPFDLIDHRGRAVRDTAFRGRVMVIYFGYTFCPDICPTELATMAGALDLLGEAGEDAQPLFVSIDPKRDTPEVLADYVRHFHPRLVGLTGDRASVARAAKAYRIHARVAGDADAPDYLIDHSSFIYLMDRGGRFAGLFPPLTDPQDLAAAIRAALAR